MTITTDATVYLDSDEQRLHPLHAVRLADPWNGWEVPIVSADELRRFIAANYASDASWDGQLVECAGVLTFHDGVNDEPDMWLAIDGLYAIDGWVWVK